MDEYKYVMIQQDTIEKNMMLDLISSFSWADWAWFEQDHTIHRKKIDAKPTDKDQITNSALYQGMCLHFYNAVNEIDKDFLITNWISSNTSDYTSYFFGDCFGDDQFNKQNRIPFFTACILAEYLNQHKITFDSVREDNFMMQYGETPESNLGDVKYAANLIIDGLKSSIIARFDENMNLLTINFETAEENGNWEDLPEPQWPRD